MSHGIIINHLNIVMQLHVTAIIIDNQLIYIGDDFLHLVHGKCKSVGGKENKAVGKLLTEFFMKDAVDTGKIKGCSIRFANVYSRDERDPKHIIPYIINSLKDDGKVVLLENSRKNRRTFLYNQDSCSAILALSRKESALDGTIYNVATDEEISILDLAKCCAAKMGIAEPVIEFHGYRESDPERRLLSTEKIRTRTSWKPLVDLDKGLDVCIQYYLHHEKV